MASPFRRIDANTRSVIVTDLIDPYIILEYDGSGNLLYMGRHYTHGTATSADDWEVFKFTVGTNGFELIEKLIGVYDDRAAPGFGWV